MTNTSAIFIGFIISILLLLSLSLLSSLSSLSTLSYISAPLFFLYTQPRYTIAMSKEETITTIYEILGKVLTDSSDKAERQHIWLYMQAIDATRTAGMLRHRFTQTKDGLAVHKRTFLIPSQKILNNTLTMAQGDDRLRANAYLKQFFVSGFIDPKGEEYKAGNVVLRGITPGSTMTVDKVGAKTATVNGKQFSLIAENEIANVYITTADLEFVKADSPEVDLGMRDEENRQARNRARQQEEGMNGAGCVIPAFAGAGAGSGIPRAVNTFAGSGAFQSIIDSFGGGKREATETMLFSGSGDGDDITGGAGAIVRSYRARYGPGMYYDRLVNDYLGYLGRTNRRKLYLTSLSYKNSPAVFASMLFGDLSGATGLVDDDDIRGFQNSGFFLNRNKINTSHNIKVLEKAITKLMEDDSNKEASDELKELRMKFVDFNSHPPADLTERTETLQKLINRFGTVYKNITGDSDNAAERAFHHVVAGNIMDILFKEFGDENASNIIKSGDYKSVNRFVREALGIDTPTIGILKKLPAIPKVLVKRNVFSPFRWRTGRMY